MKRSTDRIQDLPEPVTLTRGASRADFSRMERCHNNLKSMA